MATGCHWACAALARRCCAMPPVVACSRESADVRSLESAQCAARVPVASMSPPATDDDDNLSLLKALRQLLISGQRCTGPNVPPPHPRNGARARPGRRPAKGQTRAPDTSPAAHVALGSEWTFHVGERKRNLIQIHQLHSKTPKTTRTQSKTSQNDC